MIDRRKYALAVQIPCAGGGLVWLPIGRTALMAGAKQFVQTILADGWRVEFGGRMVNRPVLAARVEALDGAVKFHAEATGERRAAAEAFNADVLSKVAS